MLGPKKYSYKEFDNKKNSPPHRPHNFSNGPSLIVLNVKGLSTEMFFSIKNI